MLDLITTFTMEITASLSVLHVKGVFIKVKMSRRPSSRYSEMPMRVTDSRMSLINATPQKYNPSVYFYYITADVSEYTFKWFYWPELCFNIYDVLT